jgi:hypothetical protein
MEMHTVFDDPNITVVGKMFLAGVASAALGMPTHLKIRGTHEQVLAIKDAIEKAHALRASIAMPGTTVEDIAQKLAAKRASAASFKEIVGLPFPL